MKYIDAHVHYYRKESVEVSLKGLQKAFEIADIDKVCLMSIPTYGRADAIHNLKGFYYKDNFAPNAYLYGGLYYEDFDDTSDKEKYSQDFYNQVKELCENGCDGIKILEGKPSERIKTKTMLSDKVFDKMFSYLEENGIPITMHNSDPITFWDKSQMTEAEIKSGWFVGEDMPPKKELFNDVIALLKNHPNLKLTLAHFGFTTEDIAEAKEFFTFKNTKLDVCPGGEQYVNITNNYDEWRQFIVDNIDRFVFGTDCSNISCDYDWFEGFIKTKYGRIKRFYETFDEYDNGKAIVKGIGLSKSECEKLFYKNILNECGEVKSINIDYVLSEINRLEKEVLDEFDTNDLRVIKEYFTNKYCK